MEKLQKAFADACRQHKGQIRKGSGIPYFTHCVEVMKFLADCGFRDENLLCAAVLHDVIEDCDATFEKLKQKYGKEVAILVWECSRDPGGDNDNQKKLDFLKTFETKSEKSVFIKVADRVCNMIDYRKSGLIDYSNYYALQAYPLAIRMGEVIEGLDDKTDPVYKLAYLGLSIKKYGVDFLIKRKFGDKIPSRIYIDYDEYLDEGDSIDEIIVNHRKTYDEKIRLHD